MINLKDSTGYTWSLFVSQIKADLVKGSDKYDISVQNLWLTWLQVHTLHLSY